MKKTGHTGVNWAILITVLCTILSRSVVAQQDGDFAVRADGSELLLGEIITTEINGHSVFRLVDSLDRSIKLNPYDFAYFVIANPEKNKVATYRSFPTSDGRDFLRLVYNKDGGIYASDVGEYYLFDVRDSSSIRVPVEREGRAILYDSLLQGRVKLKSRSMYRPGLGGLRAFVDHRRSNFARYPSRYYLVRTFGGYHSENYDLIKTSGGPPESELPFNGRRIGIEISMLDGFNERGSLVYTASVGCSIDRARGALESGITTFSLARNATTVYGDLGLRYYYLNASVFPYLELGAQWNQLVKSQQLFTVFEQRGEDVYVSNNVVSGAKSGPAARLSAGLELPLNTNRFVDLRFSLLTLHHTTANGKFEYQLGVATNLIR